MNPGILSLFFAGRSPIYVFDEWVKTPRHLISVNPEKRHVAQQIDHMRVGARATDEFWIVNFMAILERYSIRLDNE